MPTKNLHEIKEIQKGIESKFESLNNLSSKSQYIEKGCGGNLPQAVIPITNRL